MKSLKKIPKRETCSPFLEGSQIQNGTLPLQKINKLLKIEDRTFSDWENDFEASFLNGTDHAFAGF